MNYSPGFSVLLLMNVQSSKSFKHDNKNNQPKLPIFIFIGALSHPVNEAPINSKPAR